MAHSGGLSAFLFAGVCFNIMGLISHLIGTATSEWFSTIAGGQTISLGLFRYCIDQTCDTFSQSTTIATVKAATAVALIGAVLALAAIGLAVSHIVKPAYRALLQVSGVVSVVACVSVIVGSFLWTARIIPNMPAGMFWYMGYSFCVSTSGGALMLVGGVCLLLARSPSKS